ncbi:hypothetical protein [Salinispira pacifica]|uniref:Uncharacterized protein n=1 Tax=Salinispira pacifica TaxID=1307761 RepID=V5WFJ1_9SPIO|nr:hypothetical protein [Salinispira pacifica]AHC14410.1 hypothetical protein L21SP2_0992 [Salinispira pacifica]
MIAANLLVLGVIVLMLTPGILKIRADRQRRKRLPPNVFPGCASCPLLDHCTAPAESCSAAGGGDGFGHATAGSPTATERRRSGAARPDPGCSCG